MSESHTFHKAFHGYFTSLLRWQQLDESWNVVRRNAGIGWCLDAIGTPVPVHQRSADNVVSFIAEVDKLLHSEHREDNRGIVHTDSMEAPALIKNFDPNNPGVSCGFSNNPLLPGCVMSLIPTQPIESLHPLPASGQRWRQIS